MGDVQRPALASSAGPPTISPASAKSHEDQGDEGGKAPVGKGLQRLFGTA
jgi:hypothetical protein